MMGACFMESGNKPSNEELYGADCDYGMEGEQAKLLLVMDEFHRRCEACGARYSLHGGALLGAVRNGRFIPWDDDLDVAMTRHDYELFKRTQDFSGSRLHLDETSMWFPRLVMADEDGVYYIDILIYDHISSNPVARIMKLTLLRFVQGMMKEDPEYEKFGPFNRFLLWSTHGIGLLFSNEAKARFYRTIEGMFEGSKELMHRSNDSFHAITELHDAGFMDEYGTICFEGREYCVNARYEEFLLAWYGSDYLTPPPPDKRKPSHSKFRSSLSG